MELTVQRMLQIKAICLWITDKLSFHFIVTHHINPSRHFVNYFIICCVTFNIWWDEFCWLNRIHSVYTFYHPPLNFYELCVSDIICASILEITIVIVECEIWCLFKRFRELTFLFSDCRTAKISKKELRDQTCG